MLIALLGALVFVIGAIVVTFQIRGGRFFTLLTFATGLFLLEGVGGALKAGLPGIFPDFASTTSDNPLPFVPRALAIYILAYLLFLCGYLCTALFSSMRKVRREAVAEAFFDRFWTPSFQIVLMVLTLVTISIGFVQHYQHIRAAGGLSEFLATAYQHRFGTETESSQTNALVGLANLISGSAVGLTVFWIIAWARNRLTLWSKIFVLVMVFLLLFRQWTSMFRGAFLFSILAIIAGVESERKLPIRRVVAIAAIVIALLMVTNFVHYYLYFATAGWDRQGFLQTQAQLVAPHAHLHTLAFILARDSAAPGHLHGAGLLESIFFFVPRVIWHSKLANDAYGTMAVQAWAGLSTEYQTAVTPVGELIAQFGYLAIVLMIFYGFVYGLLDGFRNATPDLRAALFGMLLPRVLADLGMGIAALSITLLSLAIFLAEIYGAEFVSRVLRSLSRRLPRGRSGVRGGMLNSAR